jgi:integration host factor subunit alpha
LKGLMNMPTLTRSDLMEAVYSEVGLSRKQSSEMVEQFLGEVLGTLEKGNSVKLSAFGNFSIRSKNERIGRNPKTGEEVPITPRKVLVFKASHVLKDRINNG